MTEFKPTEDHARRLDAQDPLAHFRDEFVIPHFGRPEPCIYLTGNSLGAMPKAVPDLLKQETDDWARLGVEGHTHGRDPWLPYHEQFRAPLARLVGALEHEVVAMNTLTTNLHLLMVSFYRPTPDRFKIFIEDSAFPSDSYAVASQARFHGFDPARAVVRLTPREGEHTLRTEDVLAAIDREKPALIMLGAVNYLTGQFFDMDAITAAGKKAGAIVGWDLAHAAGNVPMNLHDCGGGGADFAAWCSYKYLNSGPGAIAGAFIHERHVAQASGLCAPASLPRFEGWWGSHPTSRFKMAPEITPTPSADAWSLSNPPIFSLTPLKASLALFDRATMPRLRAKSLQLTDYMRRLLHADLRTHAVRTLTPDAPEARGCQLSLVVPGASRETQQRLLANGVVCDFREPNVVRAAPVPLYNSFHDVWKFVNTLGAVLTA